MQHADRQSHARRGTRDLAAPPPRPGLRPEKDLTHPADKLPRIALTCGEPAGIGPDICIRLAQEPIAARLAWLGDPAVFTERARLLGLPLAIVPLERIGEAPAHEPGRLALLPVPLAAPVTPGRLDPANARGVVRTLELGARACLAGEAAAMVTAPVQKSTINEGGIRFSGHTEYLAELTGTRRVVMLLASAKLKVALVTTHLPLAAVPAAITREALEATLRIVDADFRSRFRIARPRITVLGLNPHAGEAGLLGREEIETIGPVVEALRGEGLLLRGPVAGDTAFTDEALGDTDVVVAMYHDQGLGPLKARHFGEIVNVTLGLPILRTSVDHGTALSLAGSGKARHASLRAALDFALGLATGRGA